MFGGSDVHQIRLRLCDAFKVMVDVIACSKSVIILNKEALPCVLRLHKVTASNLF